MIQTATETQILDFFQKEYGNKKQRCFACYNSDLDKIIVEQKYMLIPLDQRMATRAHAVFDTIYVKKLTLINAEKHIDRLLSSAKSLQIQCPVSREKIKDVMKALVKAAIKQKQGFNQQNTVFCIRLILSAGHGDFGIASLGLKPTLYASIFQPFLKYDKEGVKEYVVKIVQPHTIVQAKTVSYAQNAIMANESKKRGGYQGIKMTTDNILLQAAVANIAFIFEGGEFATPRFQTVIKGTTLVACLEELENMKKQGILKGISFRDISLQEAYSAKEMMVVGGDKIIPVLFLNDREISKERGPIVTRLQSWYEKTIQKPAPIF